MIVKYTDFTVSEGSTADLDKVTSAPAEVAVKGGNDGSVYTLIMVDPDAPSRTAKNRK